ncbi:MAG: hypothetical protein JXA89_10410 [Anaerolineae bacterium]|nr:hypothetical protein [Anaerolineae bacterium]
MSPLTALTSLVDFMALAVSLWLGLYIVTRSPRSRVSWLAGLTLWSLAGYFLDSFLHLNPPPTRALDWWTGWSIFFTAPLWLHLATFLLPQSKPWQRILPWLAHGLAVTLLLIELTSGRVLGTLTDRPFIYATAQRPGPLYLWLCALLILPPTLAALYLLWGKSQCARRALRDRFDALWSATVLATAATAYLTMTVWFRLDVPLLWGHVVMAAALVMLGYGVARYNALIEGRASRADFGYSTLAMAVVGGLYVLVVYLSYLAFDIPFSVFVFVLILVILSHSLYEWGSISLERFFYRRQYLELKSNLRAFAREAIGRDFGEQMQPVLDVLCRTFGCAWGWIGVRQADRWIHAASYPLGYPSPSLTSDLLTNEIVLLDGQAIVPLYTQDEQVGAIVLGERARGEAYTEDDLDVLDTLADQLAGVVYAARQQVASVAQIDALVGEFRAREKTLQAELQNMLDSERAPSIPDDSAQMRQLVEDALRHLYDYAYLGEHALARLEVIRPYLGDRATTITHLDRGRALSQMLVDVIDRLHPPGAQPRELTREWIQYTILHDAYVQGELNRDIMSKLYISESGFNRARRRAVRGVAQAVAEMEHAAQTPT